MSYVGLKHLLAELALEAVRDPAGAHWPPVVSAYAALAASVPAGRVPRAEVLAHAAALAHPPAPPPTGADLEHLISRGLLFAPDDRTVALREVFLPHAAYLRRQAPRLLGAWADLRRSAAPDAGAAGDRPAAVETAAVETGAASERGASPRAGAGAETGAAADAGAREVSTAADEPTGVGAGAATDTGAAATAEAATGVAAAAGAPEEVRIGAALFNHGLFFECHEWFEGVWKAAAGPERDLYQGLVQAAAAFYHFEKGNRHGRVVLLRKARGRLARYPARVLGFDLGGFADALARWEAHFNGGPQPEAYPVMTLLPPAEYAKTQAGESDPGVRASDPGRAEG